MGNIVSLEPPEEPTEVEQRSITREKSFVNHPLNFQVKQDLDPNEVVEIAERAGELILDIYNQEQENWDVAVKSDSSPLTKADSRANEYICEELQRIAPHIPIISEENKLTAYRIRKHYQYCWCVDPLDGTKEFIKRNGQFTVNIALLKGNQPILGVVHTPCLKTTHWAVEGKGAYLRNAQGDQQIQVASFKPTDEGLIIVASASHLTDETKEFIENFKEPQFKQLGSSLKLLLVAEGKAHVYPRMAPTSEWDTAASQIIVTEAGGTVLQAGGKNDWKEALQKRQPVVYNKEEALNPFFVVYGKLVLPPKEGASAETEQGQVNGGDASDAGEGQQEGS